MKYQIPKGLFDIVPYDGEDWRIIDKWQYVESVFRNLALDFGYEEIRTPIFEKTELFQRVGQTSDIVTKEMYNFEDRAGRLLSLRPEGTSSVIRALLEKNMLQNRKTHKLFYIGPMFRYERPQSGRYRQHHQFGVEAIGKKSIEQDAETIHMLWEFYSRLGISNIKLHLNSIGGNTSRNQYKTALLKFLKPHLHALSKESQVRFEKNPLRILDSKDSKDREILKKAPSILDHLNKEEKKYFEELQTLLTEIQIPFEISDHIVRGLDYYNEIVFEITCEDFSGTQNSLGAGGRYDGLIHSFGGANIPSTGFATGVERVLQTMIQQKAFFPPKRHSFLYFIPLCKAAETLCFIWASELRINKISSDMDFTAKKIQASLQKASQLEVDFCIIVGEDEIKSKTFKLKNMKTREEKTVAAVLFLQEIEHHWSKIHVGLQQNPSL